MAEHCTRDKTPSLREQIRRRIQSYAASRPSNRSIRRHALYATEHGRKAFATLMAVLAQHGGEVTVTVGTLEQVNAEYAHLGFEVVPTAEGKEFVVKMTHSGAGADTPGTEPALPETPTEETSVDATAV